MLLKKMILGGGMLLTLHSFETLAADNCIYYPKDYTIPNSILYIDPDAEVGTVLAKGEVVTSGVKALCLLNQRSGKYASAMKNSFTTVVSSNDKGNIYESGVPGIGVQVSDLQRRVLMVPYETNIRYQDLMPWETIGRTTVYFIKTGNISKGETYKGIIAEYKLDKEIVATVSLSTNIAWTKKSCVVEPGQRNQSVPMPPTSYTAFGEIGTTGPSKEFYVSLKCEAEDAPVFVSFEPTTGSTGDGILNIDSSVTGAAEGVAIEILNKSDLTPLIFSNEIKYHTQKETLVTIPFVARYKKIASKVTAGTANAAMTFTINQY